LDDVTKCVKPTCGEFQKILTDGSCEDCPSHTGPSEDQITCKADKCTERDYLTVRGICEPCNEYERA
jgi:hypothetical protein